MGSTMRQDTVKKIHEITFPAILSAVSFGYLIYSLLLGEPISKGLPSPTFFPTLLGVTSFLLSLVLLYRAIQPADASSEESKKEKISTIRPMLVIVVTAVYILMFSYAGYFISSVLYIFCVISIFSSLSKPLVSAAGSVVITTMGLIVFEYMFRIRLPGILE